MRTLGRAKDLFQLSLPLPLPLLLLYGGIGDDYQAPLRQFPCLKKSGYGPTDRQTDGPMDGPTDQRRDKASHRDAWTHLKISFSLNDFLR